MILISSVDGYSQHTQRLRGKVTDKESRSPLIGVSVALPGLPARPGAVTDVNGEYLINDIPVGKHTV